MISKRLGVENVRIAASSQRLSRKESVTTPARKKFAEFYYREHVILKSTNFYFHENATLKLPKFGRC